MGKRCARYLCVTYCFFLVGCDQVVSGAGSELPVKKPPEIVVLPPDYSLVPTPCLAYRELIEANADCPARRAALVEQESSCNPRAISFDKGEGLCQFTGSTGPNLAEGMCRDLGPFQPFNEFWAVPCCMRFIESLTDVYTPKGVRTGEMRFNGGYWVLWELSEAVLHGLEPTLGNAKLFCGTLLANGRKRAAKWCDWNYDYYKHIERREYKYDGYLKGECNVRTGADND